MKVKNCHVGVLLVAFSLGFLFTYEFYLKLILENHWILNIGIGLICFFPLYIGLEKLLGRMDKAFYLKVFKLEGSVRRLRGASAIVIGLLVFLIFEVYIKANLAVSDLFRFMCFFIAFYLITYGLKHFIPAKHLISPDSAPIEKTESKYKKILD